MKQLFSLNKFLIRYKWRLLLGIFFVFMSNYFRVLMPGTIRDALDFVLGEVQSFKAMTDPVLKDAAFSDLGISLMKFGGLVLLYALLMGVFMYFMRQTIIVVSRLIEYDMRKEIFAHYESMDWSFFKTNRTGDLMSRISEDVSKVRMYLGPAILYTINLSSLFILALSCMLQVNVKLTLYTLLPLPFLSLSIYYVSSIINKKSELIQIQLAKLNSTSQEVFSGIRIVKSYVNEKKFFKFFENENEVFKQKSLDLARVNAFFYPLMILLVSVSTIIMVIISSKQVVNQEITAGNIAEFVIYINMLTWPVIAIGWIASIVQQAAASQKRINEFLSVKSVMSRKDDSDLIIEGDLSFNDVSFTYPETGIKALNKVSFTVKKGEKLAIIGKTASGKSTIADLILRMYDVNSGDIKIGEHKISDLSLSKLRNKIGYVPQDVFLFSDNISENIAFGLNEMDQTEVETFAKYASVYEDIDSFPDKFETFVGERGVTLSGGQKQRISIARALIKKPDIVILDDCLSAVDTNTEHQIINYLNAELKDKISIIITHRISKYMQFDKILVLDNGEIVEYGKHEALIKNKGFYFEMLEKQKDADKELKYY